MRTRKWRPGGVRNRPGILSSLRPTATRAGKAERIRRHSRRPDLVGPLALITVRVYGPWTNEEPWSGSAGARPQRGLDRPSSALTLILGGRTRGSTAAEHIKR